MGWACSTYGGIGEMHTGFGLGNMRDREHSEDLGVDGRIILKNISSINKVDGV